MPRSAFKLNEIEARIVLIAESESEPYAPASEEALPIVRASALRATLMGTELDFRVIGEATPRSLHIPFTGFRLRPCVVDGDLLLEDLSLPSGALFPALLLDECIFTGVIQLGRARIRRLSLKNARVLKLNAENTHIAGPVDISGLASSQGDPVALRRGFNLKPTGASFPCRDQVCAPSRPRARGLCTASFYNSKIEGDFTANHAHFVAPPPRSLSSSEVRTAALTVGNCDIRGALYCFDVFALGGINLSRSHIHSYAWFGGSRLIGLEMEALAARSAIIESGLYLNEFDRNNNRRQSTRFFQARGEISLVAARVHGQMVVVGRLLPLPDGSGSFDASGISISGDCAFSAVSGRNARNERLLRFFVAHYPLVLSNASIGGGLTFVCVALRAGNLGHALKADGLKLQGDFTWSQSFNLNCKLSLSSVTVEGGIDISRAEFLGSVRFVGVRIVSRRHRPEAILGTGVRIAGECSFSTSRQAFRSPANEPVVLMQRCTTDAPILFDRAHIGTLKLQSVSFRGYIALILEGAHLSKVDVRADLPGYSNRFFGGISLLHANVANSIDLLDTMVTSRYEALSFVNATIGAKVNLGLGEQRFLSLGTLNFAAARINNPVMASGDFRTTRAQEAQRFTEELRLPAKESLLDTAESEEVRHHREDLLKKRRELLRRKFLESPSGTAGRFAIDMFMADVSGWDFSDCKLRGSVKIEQSVVQRLLSFADSEFHSASLRIVQTEIRGQLELSGTSFLEVKPYSTILDLSASKVTSAASIRLGRIEAPSSTSCWIDLRDTRIHDLKDDDGQGWGAETRLRLEGFSTERLPQRQPGLVPAKITNLHLAWLERQFMDPRHPKVSEFTPGVYNSLSGLLREEGHDDDSKMILKAKLRIQRQVSSGANRWTLGWLYDNLFDFGLSGAKAFATWSICILAGWLVVAYSNDQLPLLAVLHKQPIMVVSTSTVNTVVVADEEDPAHRYTTAFPYVDIEPSKGREKSEPAPAIRAVTTEISCGHRISPGLYALETFTPALNLHQTELCEISAEPSARVWRWMRAAYTLLGWIVTSIFVLTVPGVLRSRAEE